MYSLRPGVSLKVKLLTVSLYSVALMTPLCCENHMPKMSTFHELKKKTPQPCFQLCVNDPEVFSAGKIVHQRGLFIQQLG